jgi:hypothetical protein
MFGGEGLFLTTLTGPGVVYLQSMPFDRIVDQVAKRVPGGGGFGMALPIGESTHASKQRRGRYKQKEQRERRGRISGSRVVQSCVRLGEATG